MGDPTNAEREMLEQWKAERAELDGLITALERRISMRGGALPMDAKAGSGKILADAFFRLSTPEAIKKYLRIVGKPARATTDIIDGLKAGGIDANYNNTYTALLRLQKRREVAKIGDTWGLEEWYPPAASSREKASNGQAAAVNEEETVGSETQETDIEQ